MSTESEVDTSAIEDLDFEVRCSMHTYKMESLATIRKCENPAKYWAKMYSHKRHKWAPGFICQPCLSNFFDQVIKRKAFCNNCREVGDTIKDLRSI